MKTTKQKKKKCTICKERFPYFNSLQKYCSPKCAVKGASKRGKKKTSKKKRLDRDITALVRNHVIKRDKGLCQKCGKKPVGRDLQLSHVKSKGAYKHLNYDVTNVKIMCYQCHIQWWHKEPSDAWEWFQREFPYRADYLTEQPKTVPNFYTIENLERILKEVKLL